MKTILKIGIGILIFCLGVMCSYGMKEEKKENENELIKEANISSYFDTQLRKETGLLLAEKDMTYTYTTFPSISFEIHKMTTQDKTKENVEKFLKRNKKNTYVTFNFLILDGMDSKKVKENITNDVKNLPRLKGTHVKVNFTKFQVVENMK